MDGYGLSLLLDTIDGREIEYIISDYFQMGLIGSSGMPLFISSEMDTIHFFHGKKRYGQLHVTIKQREDDRIWLQVCEVELFEDQEDIEETYQTSKARENARRLAEYRRIWEEEHIRKKPQIKLRKLGESC